MSGFVHLVVFFSFSLLQQCFGDSYSSGLCGYNNASCHHQLGNENATEADCEMIYFPTNSKECSEWVPHGSPERMLGTTELEVFVHTKNGYIVPVVNVSFLNIHWERLRMRFLLNKPNCSKAVCREFRLPAEVARSRRLYYDCPWVDPNNDSYINCYKGQLYDFEYEAHGGGRREYGKFVLQVPFYPPEAASKLNLSEWPLFVYLDVTKAPVLTVHWALTPRWLRGVQYHVDGYEVTLHYNTSVGGPEVSRPLGHVGPGQELRLTCDVGSASGAYRFGVRISHPACGLAGCHLSYSPAINIKGSPDEFPTAVVACAMLILMVLAALVFFKGRCSAAGKTTPVLLVVYVPTLKAHIRVVTKLVEYLRASCGLTVLLHDTDLPGEKVEGLQAWFSDAYERANFVMVVSSPFHHTDLRETVYVSAGEIGLKLLRLKFAEPGRPPGSFFSVVLPYCRKGDLPKDAAPFRTFSLMRDLDGMLEYVRGGGAASVLAKVPAALRPATPGGSAHYKVHGEELAAALAEALDEVQRHSSVRTVGYFLGEGAHVPLLPAPETHSVDAPADTTPGLPEVAGTPGVAASPAQAHSPWYPGNLLPTLRVEAGEPVKKSANRRCVDRHLPL